MKKYSLNFDHKQFIGKSQDLIPLGVEFPAPWGVHLRYEPVYTQKS